VLLLLLLLLLHEVYGVHVGLHLRVLLLLLL
jgi:hypothetical protein